MRLHRRDNRQGAIAEMLSASITYDRVRRKQVGLVSLALAIPLDLVTGARFTPESVAVLGGYTS